MKDKIITFMFASFIIAFSILHLVIKDDEISYSERRKLTTFPEFKLNSKYITEIDEYLLDHFPFREIFRSIKANFNYNILNKKKCQRFLLTFFFSFFTDILFPYKKLHFRLKIFFFPFTRTNIFFCSNKYSTAL